LWFEFESRNNATKNCITDICTDTEPAIQSIWLIFPPPDDQLFGAVPGPRFVGYAKVNSLTVSTWPFGYNMAVIVFGLYPDVLRAENQKIL
jgi:hypothetical protein